MVRIDCSFTPCFLPQGIATYLQLRCRVTILSLSVSSHSISSLRIPLQMRNPIEINGFNTQSGGREAPNGAPYTQAHHPKRGSTRWIVAKRHYLQLTCNSCGIIVCACHNVNADAHGVFRQERVSSVGVLAASRHGFIIMGDSIAEPVVVNG